MPDLEKVLRTWTHMITHDKKGKISKGFRELILETILCLEELKSIKRSQGE